MIGLERTTEAGRARLIFFALGWLFFVLGILGILLPVMPGTVFMILALWAFSRSSRRFHDWLYYHRWFGPSLQRWRAYRVVPWSARAVAYGSMLASLVFTGLIAKLHPAVPLSIAALAIIAVLYISRCPSRIGEIRLVTRRWQGERGDGELVVGDLDEPGWFRSLAIGDSGPAVRSGDLAIVLADVHQGRLFRHVTFRAAGGDVEALLAAYLDGFGALAADLCESKAVLIDAEAGELVSLSCWRDRAALETFLDHPDLEAARAKTAPHVAGPPVAESLEIARR